MKKIGLIGGLSWLSSAEYYRRVNELVGEKLGGLNSAYLVMESVNREEYADCVYRRKDEAAAARIILDAARSVEAAGAEFIVLCCNDIHRFLSVIQPQISIPFLHIAQATGEAIKQQELHTVALIGVRKTMEESFFADVLKQHGIKTIIPNSAERDTIDNTLMEELVRGIFSDETRIIYLDIIRRLHSRGAQGVILGCTEIPLLVRPQDVDIPVFSTTEIHCKAAVEKSIADEE